MKESRFITVVDEKIEIRPLPSGNEFVPVAAPVDSDLSKIFVLVNQVFSDRVSCEEWIDQQEEIILGKLVLLAPKFFMGDDNQLHSYDCDNPDCSH